MNKPLRYGLLGLGVLLAGAGVFVSFYLKTLNPRLKARVTQALEERFDADVDLKSLNVSLFPQPMVEGEGLRIRHRGWDEANVGAWVACRSLLGSSRRIREQHR